LGTVHIDVDNFNMNGIIIAHSLEIDASTVNMNYNSSCADFLDAEEETPLIVEDEDNLDIGENYSEDVPDEDVESDGHGIDYAKNQILVTAKNSTSFDEVEEYFEEKNAEIVGYIELTNDYQIKYQSEQTLENLYDSISDVRGNTLFEGASLNTIFECTPTAASSFSTSDSMWSESEVGEWDEDNPAGDNWGAEKIKVASAIQQIEDMNALYNVKIGLIDAYVTGHEDLEGLTTYNSFTDKEYNTHILEMLSDAKLRTHVSDVIHGNHVAGIMGASYNNGKGIFGSSIKNRLYGVSLFDIDDAYYHNTDCEMMGLKCALVQLIGNNVKVINYSMSNGVIQCIGASNGNENAINYLKTNAAILSDFLSKLIDNDYDFYIITAAGNDNDINYVKVIPSIDRVLFSKYESSAKYGYVIADNCETSELEDKEILVGDVKAKYSSFFNCIENMKVKNHIICVGSIYNVSDSESETSDSISVFSNLGDRVDIYAPGEEILSTYNSTQDELPDYIIMNGTSMAAPQVSGAIGLALSVNPTLAVYRMKAFLLNSTKKESRTVMMDGEETEVPYNVLNVSELIKTVKKESKANIALEQSTGNIIGQVFETDELGESIPVEDATVTIIYDSTMETVKTCQTDENGIYNFTLPAGKYNYNISKKSYISDMGFTDEVKPEETLYMDAITLVKETESAATEYGTAAGRVVDAITGSVIKGAIVRFRRGLNNKTGEYVKMANGQIRQQVIGEGGIFTQLMECGYYTVEVSQEGYKTYYYNFHCTSNTMYCLITLIQEFDEYEYTVVLTWNDRPSDLNLVPYFTGNYEAYYVDDAYTYGRDIMIICLEDELGDYSYYVEDHSNIGNDESVALTHTSAKVTVYKGSELFKTYYAPVGVSGTRWDVFEIQDGEFLTVNTIS